MAHSRRGGADRVPHSAPGGPQLTESIAVSGISEPLYVATTETGAVRVIDGLRRLAAAAALGLTDVPVTHRPLIQVTVLTAHPGNIRKDLKISAQFAKSIAVSGVRTAIQVTRAPGGELRVVDGHRRLAAAIKAGITHVSYTYEDQDEAGQMLDMVTTARHRAALTGAEERAALFEAASLGADAAQMAAAAALPLARAKEIKKLVKSEQVRAIAAKAPNIDLEEFAILAELEKTDPEAAARATAEIAAHPDDRHHGWIVRRARTDSQARAKLAAHRAELEATGAKIRSEDELREGATWVSRLPGLTAESHAECQGHVWVAGSSRYEAYCTNPALYGHDLPAPTTAPKPSAAQRRATIEGGKNWDTAEEIRREWLAKFFGKARRPRAESDLMTTITARVLMSGADVISRRATHPKSTGRLTGWFGIKEHSGSEARARAVTSAKAVAMAFGAVATAYEQHAVRTVWRTDEHHAGSEVRAVTGEYLGWLVSLGYQPSPIEQAVIDGRPYNPGATAMAADAAEGKTLN
ncbi:ParB/Srx family N-terminal domain-containing protein [Streptomyces virginiae]|uniref:ParB/Srx family N-terminal domain-containing protein n=1 Tax=Streptomyces virginiae TaxID=1961 RepID=UPI00224D84CE|nr:ParB/Srx family N-terminal domain-containing protein [Streptomyces virginiae]MCX5174253.1 ParB/Srx family N-terminal domain-containing protein [Streptomyces virginiae]